MKNLSVLLCAMALVIGATGIANATLWDRGGGLIYDDVLDITWLQDANYAATSGYTEDPLGRMYWDEAVEWAGNLEYYDSVRDTIWDDWRLPEVLPINGASYENEWQTDGSTDVGYNMSAPGSAYPESTASEMAYMYYNNLGELGFYLVDGTVIGDDGTHNSGPFENLQLDFYWSGTERSDGSNFVYDFYFSSGTQDLHEKDFSLVYAWGVRDGDVTPVPEPSTILLICSGLVGIMAFRRKFKKS